MATEVFNRIGESEIQSGGSGSFRKYDQEYGNTGDEFEGMDKPKQSTEKVESTKLLTPEKQKFLKQIYGDDESLTVDTCGKVNKDWKKRN